MAFVAKGIACQTNDNNCNYGIAGHRKFSEQKSEFGFKTSSNDVTYEKATPSQKLQFTRQSFNRANQLMPSGIKMDSTYQRDFSPKSLVLDHPISYDAFCDRISQRAVDRCVYAHQPGYQKYLDIYAPLDYPLHPNAENGISRRDHITQWDWFEVPKAKGATVRVEVPPQKCIDDQQKSVIRPYAKNNFVPNRGLLTEHQEHYRFK